MKKQATIFGASCMERADIARLHVQDTNNLYKYWTDEDFDAEFDMLMENVTPRKNVRIFNNRKEDWEDEAVYQKDPVHEAKILANYGGLQWYDIDTKQTFYSDPSNIRWSHVGKTRKGEKTGGYWLIGYDDGYDEGYDKEDEQTAEEHTEHWILHTTEITRKWE
jgi:hypothetical protein